MQQRINLPTFKQTLVTKNWLKLSLVALAIAGIYSIFLVILRAPIISHLFKDKSIFNTALIIHVDLSVLFWMLCITGLLITKALSDKYYFIISNLQKLLYLSLGCICLSPIFGEAKPFLNNYVPMIHNLSFIMGIAIFFSVLSIIAFLGLFRTNSIATKTTSLIILSSLLSFSISAYRLKASAYTYDLHSFYEILFWGCGHLLQFVYTQILIVIWYKFFVEHAVLLKQKILLLFNCLIVIPMPILQFFNSANNFSEIELYTWHMRVFGGVAPTLAALLIVISDLKPNDNAFTPLFEIKKNAFNLSALLFFTGGIIGLLIHGTDVTIPAHYHGSIVGITIALMGYIYILIDKYYGSFNYKAAKRQLKMYTVGQLIHILALAYSGGYGALRKTPGSEIAIQTKVAMSIMGLGGLIAIIAGLMFVFICGKTILINKIVETNHNGA